MYGLRFLRATILFYEVESVTQAAAQAHPDAMRLTCMERNIADRANGRLAAQGSDHRLDDGRKQKGENKVSGNAAGRIVFPDFRHSSSQGFELGNFPSHRSTRRDYTRSAMGDKLCGDITGLAAWPDRGAYKQTA